MKFLVYIVLVVMNLYVLLNYIIPAAAYGQDAISSPKYFEVHSTKSGERVAIYFDPIQQVGFGIEYEVGETDCSKLLFAINSLYAYNRESETSNISIKIDMSIDGRKPYTDVLNGSLHQYPDAETPIDIYSFVIIMTDEFILDITDAKEMNYRDSTYPEGQITTIDITNLLGVVQEVISSCITRNKGYNLTGKEYRA